MKKFVVCAVTGTHLEDYLNGTCLFHPKRPESGRLINLFQEIREIPGRGTYSVYRVVWEVE